MSLQAQLEATDRVALASATKRDQQAREMITMQLRNALAMYVAYMHQPDDVIEFDIRFRAWPDKDTAYGVLITEPVINVSKE